MEVVRFLGIATFALAFWVVSAGAQTRESCAGLLCISTETRGEVSTLTARNAARHAPLSVALAVRLDGLAARGTDRAVLAPGETRKLLTLTPTGPGQGTIAYEFTWIPGDFRARPDPGASYTLPFRNAAFSVLQGCDGWFSHRGDARHSIDFAMPVGTPVHAAREGRVIFTRMDSQRGGWSRKFIEDDNKVLVQHDDGSVASYSHLSYQSARVVPGQRVRAGDLLALSGNTGFSAQPHLHFELYTPKPEGGHQSWPVAWAVGRERIVCPRRGTLLRN